MSQQTNKEDETARESGETAGEAGDNQENELEAEQESAAAMDADVPQPTDADRTTKGQPS
jgi:hypothetical protein